MNEKIEAAEQQLAEDKKRLDAAQARVLIAKGELKAAHEQKAAALLAVEDGEKLGKANLTRAEAMIQKLAAEVQELEALIPARRERVAKRTEELRALVAERDAERIHALEQAAKDAEASTAQAVERLASAVRAELAVEDERVTAARRVGAHVRPVVRDRVLLGLLQAGVLSADQTTASVSILSAMFPSAEELARREAQQKADAEAQRAERVRQAPREIELLERRRADAMTAMAGHPEPVRLAEIDRELAVWRELVEPVVDDTELVRVGA